MRHRTNTLTTNWLRVGIGVAAALAVCTAPTGAQKAAYEKDYDIKREHRASLYDKWTEQLPKKPVRVSVVEDVMTQPVEASPELGTGVKTTYLRLLDNQMVDVVIYELAPGASTKAHRHTYEEFMYVASGSGETVFTRAKRQQRLVWKGDGFFAVPFNTTHSHVNTGAVPVRLVAITSTPFMVNIGGTNEYLYTNSLDFDDRYKLQEDFFSRSSKSARRFSQSNFVPSLRGAAMDPYPERGGSNMHWENMGGNTLLGTHVSEFPVDSYKRAHRHRHEAIIYILNGTGYSLVWKNPGDKPEKVDWREGGLFLAPVYWFHQHFNTGNEPVRYLAITSGGALGQMGIDDREEQGTGDEDPAIRKLFESELQKRKSTSK